MKKQHAGPIIALVIFLFSNLLAFAQTPAATAVSIKKGAFYINGKLTYKGRTWEGNKIEGLLMNSRMVQGVFDDLNPETVNNFIYPDIKKWDANRNTDEFVAAMETWYQHGLLSFTLNLQGGSPVGYGNHNWVNSTFDEKGNLRPAYMDRLVRILNKADELAMVVILGYFYFGQDQFLENERAIINAADNITDWIIDKGYRNILVEVNNECNVKKYDHAILKEDRIHELIATVQKNSKGKLLVGTSYGGGFVPLSNVVKISDFILIHGNGVHEPKGIRELVRKTKQVDGFANQPILFNEDDHFDFHADDYNFKAAVELYTSWGYFDYRMDGESFEDGYQSVPVDWGINSPRKKAFFAKLKEITGF